MTTIVLPSQAVLQAILDYDPETGIFTWKHRPEATGRARGWIASRVGTAAGTVSPRGYLRIKVNDTVYMAHRLAWVYVYGDLPDGLFLDHINRNRLDNSIANLRLANRYENAANRGANRNTASGVKGVHQCKGRWQARIKVAKQELYLGSFNTMEEASAAYADAAERFHGEFARVA